MGISRVLPRAEPPSEPELQEAETKLPGEDHPVYHGQLTASLVHFLEREDGLRMVFGDIAEHLQKAWIEHASPHFSEEIRRRPLWQSAAHFELMQRAFELEQAPLRQVIAVLKRAIGQRQKAGDYWPEGRLKAGIACAAAGDYPEARDLIEDALKIIEVPEPLKGERVPVKWKADYSPQEVQDLLKQAKYHLGRVFYEGQLDFDRAVSELEEAVRLNPENIGAHYYLGQAIREQIERNKVKRAREVLRTYLMEGAPLGHEDEVREFLGSRKQYAARENDQS